MSQENVKLFYQALATDEALKAQFMAVNEKHKGETPDEAALAEMFQAEVLPLAKSAGFEFTIEEAKAYNEQAGRAQKGDLSDEELDAVAGGLTCVCAFGGGGTHNGNVHCVCPLGGAGQAPRWTGSLDQDLACFCMLGGSGM